MFKIGDLINYSAHGICKVDDITEKTIAGKTRTYYILEPVHDEDKLKISAPVDNDNVVMSELITKDTAKEILTSFNSEGIEWCETPNRRLQLYSNVVKTGDRREIAKVVNTLLRERVSARVDERTFYAQDRKLLENIKESLFQELSIALGMDFEELRNQIVQTIEEDEETKTSSAK